MTEPTIIARGSASRISDRRRAIVRSEGEWTTLWAAHAGPGDVPPPIDFTSAVVAAAFAGERPSAGSTIEISVAHEDPERIQLAAHEHGPASGTVAAQILTSPFAIVALPAGRPVEWSDEPGPPDTPPDTSGKTATGLEPRTAAALAYLAGPFSGGLMLLAEPSHRYVRFHAWQSILALGGLGVVMIACYVLAFASLFFSAGGIAVLVHAATVVWVAIVVVWLLCLWTAFSGRPWRLPLVGRWAERFTASPRARAAR
jgi:uncharacterized membrane protein